MLSHLSRPKVLRLLAGAACLAASGAAGALIAQQPDPLPPGAPVAAQGAPTPPAPAKPVAISEVTLARSVLAALDADPVLKDVNLIVSVVDRAAVIGGPVTTEDVKKRAETVVRGVAGVEAVKNVCFVQADPDPLLRAMAERLKSGAKSPSPVPLPGVALAPAAPQGFLPPVPPEPPSDLVAGVKPPNTVVAQHAPLRPVSVLGAPVAPAGPATVAKVSPLPAVAPAESPPALPTTPGALTGSPAAKPTDLRTAALAVRNSDPRFARLTVEQKPDGALFISGWSATPSDVRDFATELRKIPGAGRIVSDPALVR